MLKEAHVTLDYEVESVLSKDSLDMTDGDRQLIRERIAADSCSRIVVTHGTDTMVQTALAARRHTGQDDPADRLDAACPIQSN